MISLVTGLSIAKKGMDAQQARISVSGHNIANANTDGYHAKSVTLASEYYTNMEDGYAGVNVEGYKRRANDFLLSSYLETIAKKTGAEVQSQLLGRMEEIIGEPDGQISTALKGFLDSFNDLSLNPSGQVERDAVIQSAKRLGMAFDTVSKSLINFKTDIRDELSKRIQEANQLMKSVRKMNVASAVANNQINEIEDHLERNLKELAKFMPLELNYRTDGSLAISSGGVFICDNNTVNEMRLDYDDTGKARIVLKKGGVQLKPSSNWGHIFSLVESHNEHIDNAFENLDGMVKTIVDNVNSIHKTGEDLFGQQGGNFFDPRGVTVKTFKLAGSVSGDSGFIAASPDGSTAAEIASMTTETNLSSDLEALVFDVAIRKREYDSNLEVYTQEFNAIEKRYKTETGVDVSEETMTLVTAQRTYTACAQVFKTIQELLNIALELVD